MKFRHSNRAKRVCSGYKNNGPCAWCTGNREHQWRKQVPMDDALDELTRQGHRPTEMYMPLDVYCKLAGYTDEESKRLIEYANSQEADDAEGD
jgi:hypothetical protein